MALVDEQEVAAVDDRAALRRLELQRVAADLVGEAVVLVELSDSSSASVIPAARPACQKASIASRPRRSSADGGSSFAFSA